MFKPYAPRSTLYGSIETTMPAIASLEDLKAAQKDLLAANDLDEVKVALKEVTQSSVLFTPY